MGPRGASVFCTRCCVWHDLTSTCACPATSRPARKVASRPAVSSMLAKVVALAAAMSAEREGVLTGDDLRDAHRVLSSTVDA